MVGPPCTPSLPLETEAFPFPLGATYPQLVLVNCNCTENHMNIHRHLWKWIFIDILDKIFSLRWPFDLSSFSHILPFFALFLTFQFPHLFCWLPTSGAGCVSIFKKLNSSLSLASLDTSHDRSRTIWIFDPILNGDLQIFRRPVEGWRDGIFKRCIYTHDTCL